MQTEPLTIVVAPDALKGSCSSSQTARAIAQGVRSAVGASVRVLEIPMADGGEDTLEALVSAWSGSVIEVPTTDALGRSRTGRVGFDQSKRCAIIETADANGLPAVSDEPLRPLDADSWGVGTLILSALEAGVDELLLCLGGSATNDGGAGMLRALGARLLDFEGNDIRPGARGLEDLRQIDLSGLHPGAAAVRWRIACDVDNPLTGPRGAAHVFGGQKGADAQQKLLIDEGLANFAELLATVTGASQTGDDLRELRGLGAAGGLALGPTVIFGAELLPGAELVGEAVGLREALHGASLVITGEGRLDSQSLDGKVVSQVLACADIDEQKPVPVIVIAGSVALMTAEIDEAGITAAFSIAQGPASLEQLQTDAERLLTQTAAQVCRVFVSGCNHNR